eukprot:886576-Prorocentrum_minimum.AAC.1
MKRYELETLEARLRYSGVEITVEVRTTETRSSKVVIGSNPWNRRSSPLRLVPTPGIGSTRTVLIMRSGSLDSFVRT